jgi:hypothetical protein
MCAREIGATIIGQGIAPNAGNGFFLNVLCRSVAASVAV